MAKTPQVGTSHILVATPDIPPISFFDETQWRVYYALMDTVVPSIVAGDSSRGDLKRLELDKNVCDAHYDKIQGSMTNAPSRKDFEAYLSEKLSDNQKFRDHTARIVAALPGEIRDRLGLILKFLGTRLGSYPLTGYVKPLPDLPISAREAVIQSWQTSWIPSLRGLATSLTVLGKKIFVQTSPLFRELSGWIDLPEDYRAGTRQPYAFKQFALKEVPEVVKTDVVIVGSGCGGGVCAKVLAEAGHRVLVVDKGYYFPPAQLPMRDIAAEANLFENGGVVHEDTGCLSILAGSSWGGGGSINWGVSLQTQDYVRREWAEKRELSFFATDEYQESLDRVCEFMGVSDNVRHNHRGNALLEGANKLGWDAKPVPMNSGGADHYCGHCHLGCGSGEKQGPAVSWLPAAARAGAEFIEGFQVERITFEAFASGKKASGVVGKWTSRNEEGDVNGPLEERVVRDVVIKAKRVIISCGSLWSPVILRKSGLASPQIGRNLHLHPVNLVAGYWKEDIKPWEGCAISSVCTTFENLDNEGHGAKLEPVCMAPLVFFPAFPWTSGIDFKLSALRYRHINSFISLTRDRDTGCVYPDPVSGKPRVSYAPSAFDRAHTLEGVVALARICHSTGAREIMAFITGVRPYMRPEEEDQDAGRQNEDFEAWIKEVRRIGNPVTSPWASAHQMGSCRMSKSESDGVVDPTGKVWGIEGLYVADASVFPSASGVNPMITVMAIADHIARGVSRNLKE
ncbi:long chain fatty alcohol oxidase [Pseudomassariella vexata]|uniref:Long-chain-alcohol oxidase n=1 Tax=Pseudomassariella vexata TaxID=1141098 RepID=A0A1Y2EJK6_9PEZI|nr:long chain fatty alcohol oxidase [Pseudomassariella vexata]ORY71456.1 long chain fatty alcohol oxidase [Pseudomassariella vexata]